MSVNGAVFLLFLAGVAVVYYLTPRASRWLVLLAASGVFYLSYGLRGACFLLGAAALTYGAGRWMETVSQRKRLLLTAALLANFSTLLVLKYSGFFVGNWNALFHTAYPLPRFLLPLGISFYIFQTSGYLIDVYRGKYPAERSFARYLLFVAWFPQLVQGPINRYAALRGPLFEGNDFDWENIQHGILRMLYGVLKKALVADSLAPIVERIYTGYPDYPGVVAFLGSALYCIQLYCDFSGGIDLLCGASRLFGVPMQENFSQPFFATSLSDYWRRWHISLGEWMKDYLFYPLALSKPARRLAKWARKSLPAEAAKRVVPCLATFAVFLAVGIWQGPGWSNIAYGLWNGFWMSLGLCWVPLGVRLDRRTGYKAHKKLLAVWGVLRTNFLVIIGRYFSHAASLRSALGMLKRTFAHPGFSQVSGATFAALGFGPALLVKVGLTLLLVLAVSAGRERGVDVTGWLCGRKWYVQFIVLFLGLLAAVLLVYANTEYTPIAFVYENV